MGKSLSRERLEAHFRQDGYGFEETGTVGKGQGLVRKRPNAGAVERTWRAENWSKQREPPPSEIDTSSCSPQDQLRQKFNDNVNKAEHEALRENTLFELSEEIEQHDMLQTENSSKAIDDTDGKALDVSFTGQAKGNTDDMDEGEDFVYDTYVRHRHQPNEVQFGDDGFVGPLNTAAKDKVGILVIEEEDEDAWESFAQEEDSDVDCLSDEEDENGRSHFSFFYSFFVSFFLSC